MYIFINNIKTKNLWNWIFGKFGIVIRPKEDSTKSESVKYVLILQELDQGKSK